MLRKNEIWRVLCTSRVYDALELGDTHALRGVTLLPAAAGPSLSKVHRIFQKGQGVCSLTRNGVRHCRIEQEGRTLNLQVFCIGAS